MTKLTAVQIRNAKPKDKPYKLSDGHGMYFYVAKSGMKTWRYRFKLYGKESNYTLGEYPAMSLEQARAERIKTREMVKQGKNPSQVRREEGEAAKAQEMSRKAKELGEDSFEYIALEWIKQQKGRWSKEHAKAVRATLERDAFPFIGKERADSITPPTILQIIRRIEKRGALEIAYKVLQRMNSVFRYAIQTGRATYNPAADMKGVLKQRKVKHMPALDSKDLPEFLRSLTTADINVTTRLALKFTILTAVRSGEVRGATWDEIDLEAKIWKIPAERMKMDSPHSIPLSKQALAILERIGTLYGKEGLVFPGIRYPGRPLSENTLLYAMYRLGYHGKGTVHGFRATFSTIANESGFDGDVIEKALAHEQRNRVRAAYHRSEYLEQRKELMQWWAIYLDQMEAGAEIIPIRKRA